MEGSQGLFDAIAGAHPSYVHTPYPIPHTPGCVAIFRKTDLGNRFGAEDDGEKVKAPLCLLPSGDEDMSIVSLFPVFEDEYPTWSS